jgi:hypothetical protein
LCSTHSFEQGVNHASRLLLFYSRGDTYVEKESLVVAAPAPQPAPGLALLVAAAGCAAQREGGVKRRQAAAPQAPAPAKRGKTTEDAGQKAES